MTKEFLIFDRRSGVDRATEPAGKLMVPLDELGCISTLMHNDGTEEAPEWVALDASSVRVKCLGFDVAVTQTVEQIAEWIEQLVANR